MGVLDCSLPADAAAIKKTELHALCNSVFIFTGSATYSLAISSSVRPVLAAMISIGIPADLKLAAV